MRVLYVQFRQYVQSKCVAVGQQLRNWNLPIESLCVWEALYFIVKYHSVNMSQTLIWHLIRDNNSFLVKRERTSRRGAVQFSSEPGNLLNAHSFKYSGLANNRAVDISSDLLIRTKVRSHSIRV